MSWRTWIEILGETFTAVWSGGQRVRTWSGAFTIEGELPADIGWYEFAIVGPARARPVAPSPPAPALLAEPTRGYLVGDRLVPDPIHVGGVAELSKAERVLLIEPGLARFTRICAGRPHAGGPLVYLALELPLGAEDAVLGAFLEGAASVAHVPDVPPALDAAFRIESWHRDESARRRRAEAEHRALELRRRRLVGAVGDAEEPRAVAGPDFAEAARAALARGGAEYLEHRGSPWSSEAVVRFRIERRRFECVCDRSSLRVIDTGICRTDPGAEEPGDDACTLQSLPRVILNAERRGELVVFRHV
jgi:hypothetical protein